MSSTTTQSTDTANSAKTTARSKNAGTSTVLRSFRRKFVLTNMVFASVVLLAVALVVIFVNWNYRVNDVYAALDFRIGMVQQELSSDMGPGGQNGAGPGPDLTWALRKEEGGDAGKRKGPEHRESADDQMVATSVYELRSDGSISIIDNIIDLDQNTLTDASSVVVEAVQTSNQQKVSGHIAQLDLYYMAVRKSDGALLVSLASGKYVNSAISSVLLPFGLASVAALVAFFLLSLALSRWAVKPVERAWKQQQQFIADASHELKTPLTVIIANNSILSSQPDATIGSQQKWIDSTETEVHHMQDLVNDMLLLAQMEGETRPREVEDIDFSDLVESATLQFDSVAFDNGIELESEVAEGLHVKGDKVRLSRMVGTLIDNACKYSSKGDKARVTLTRAKDACKLKVHNSGNPISAEDLPHVFDRFYRADKARTGEKAGFGLGLSIAQAIAREHDGDIVVTSSAAEGTTFTVTLPLA